MDIFSNIITTLKEGDYIKVISNKPTSIALSYCGGMDTDPEDVSPEEVVCIVNYAIDGRCCHVTTVSPLGGISFVADSEEVTGLVDPDSLTDDERMVRLCERYSAVNCFDNDAEPEAEDTIGKCMHVAGKAVKASFPQVVVQEMEVMGESSFSHLGMVRSLDFFLNGIAAMKPRKDLEKLRTLRDEVAEYVSGRRFRDFYEVRALVDGACWMIPVSYDFRKAFVCRDRDERTRFSMYLGGEYQDASLSVDRFMDECCK